MTLLFRISILLCIFFASIAYSQFKNANYLSSVEESSDSIMSALLYDSCCTFKPQRVLFETVAGGALGVMGLLAGAGLGEYFDKGKGDAEGILGVIIGLYGGYLIGSSGGVYLVAKGYNDDVTFWTPFLASAVGAVAGVVLAGSSDWKGAAGYAALYVPLLSGVLVSEILYPSKIKIEVNNKAIHIGYKYCTNTNIVFSLPLN